MALSFIFHGMQWMMDQEFVIIFAGTSEGRLLSEELMREGIPCTVSVATEYGAALLPRDPRIRVIRGRKTREEMADFMRREKPVLAVDATHPFAVRASEAIRGAAADAGVMYIRLSRNTTEPETGRGIVFTESFAEAARIINEISGNIFISTGSRDIAALTDAIADPERLYVRVLPSPESLARCAAAGIRVGHVIAMQGPFSEELNEVMFRETRAQAVLMKESGHIGGEDTKIRAAEKLGIQSIVIRNPEKEKENGESQMDFTAVLKIIRLRFKADQPSSSGESDRTAVKRYTRRLLLAGVGSGNFSTMTLECSTAILSADVIFGSGRVLAFAKKVILEQTAENVSPGDADPGQHALPRLEEMYAGDQIACFLETHPEYRHPTALVSGDTGFFSGAAGILKAFSGKKGWEVMLMPGISSAALLASKIGVSWEDARMISTHGRDMDKVNPAGWIRENPKVFILVSGPEDVRRIGKKLLRYGGESEESSVEHGGQILPVPAHAETDVNSEDAEGEARLRKQPDTEKLRLAFGTNLGMKDEAFGFCTARELAGFDRQGLTLLYAENPGAGKRILTPGIPDSEFIRNADKETGKRTVNPDENAAPGIVKTGAGAACDTVSRGGRTVPMTKEEVRVLSLSRLRLTPSAVLWDIGAGCGSISIEAARLAPGIRVYAVEMREDAAAVIRANAEKYGVDNVHLVRAKAPEGLESLPAPTHVFVGGSSGNIREILAYVKKRSPRARVVVNTVTLETEAEALSAIKSLSFTEPEVRVISAARAETAGHYHLMKAINPVTVIDCDGV